MNKADQEIFGILKEIVMNKKEGELIDPDDLIAENIIKGLFFLSLLGALAWVFLLLFSNEAPSSMSLIVGSFIGFFFGVLFFHLNNKLKNPSVIMFVLTWVSMMLGLYF